jgi:hypothetical protein
VRRQRLAASPVVFDSSDTFDRDLSAARRKEKVAGAERIEDMHMRIRDTKLLSCITQPKNTTFLYSLVCLTFFSCLPLQLESRPNTPT